MDLEKEQRKYKTQERERKRLENLEFERRERDGEEQPHLTTGAEATQQRAHERAEGARVT